MRIASPPEFACAVTHITASLKPSLYKQAPRNRYNMGSIVHLQPKWTVRLWLTSVGVAMTAWVVGLARAAIWLVELALS
jgi:hypothetical protein